WGQQYSRKLADIPSVQQEIATAVSGNLRVRLTSEEKTRLNKTSVTNPEAYQLYLKGRYHANQTTAAELKKGIEYFQQAIDKDPGYALAYGVWLTLTPRLEADGIIFPPATVFRRRRRRQRRRLNLMTRSPRHMLRLHMPCSSPTGTGQLQNESSSELSS